MISFLIDIKLLDSWDKLYLGAVGIDGEWDDGTLSGPPYHLQSSFISSSHSIRTQARLLSVYSLRTTARVVLIFCA